MKFIFTYETVAIFFLNSDHSHMLPDRAMAHTKRQNSLIIVLRSLHFSLGGKRCQTSTLTICRVYTLTVFDCQRVGDCSDAVAWYINLCIGEVELSRNAILMDVYGSTSKENHLGKYKACQAS